MNTLRLSLGLVGIGCLLAACGGKAGDDGEFDMEGSGGSGTNGGTGGSGESGGDGDGDTGGDGTGGDGSTAGAGGSGSGSGAQALLNPDLLVDLIYLGPSDSVQTYFSASYRGGQLIFEEDTCVTEQSGDCLLRRCSGVPPTLAEYPNAGALTVSFEFPTDTLSETILPNADGTYTGNYVFQTAPVLFGRSGTVAAQGAEIGSFSQMITMPAPLKTLVDGVADIGGATVSVSGDSALSITWEPGEVGNFYLAQSPTPEPQAGVERLDLTCAFAAETGQGTVDASFMSELPVGTRINTYSTALYDSMLSGTLVRVRAVADTTDMNQNYPLAFVVE